MATPCDHPYTTSTHALGAHCADCKEPLVSLFSSVSRNTPTGAILHGMRQANQDRLSPEDEQAFTRSPSLVPERLKALKSFSPGSR